MINRSAPRATIVPVLIYEDVGKAVEWLCGAFGFSERLRAAGSDGKVTHAQLAVAEGAIMMGAGRGGLRPPRPNEVNQYVHVHVDDVDKHFEQAKQFGARILSGPVNQPFGERQVHRGGSRRSLVDVLSVDGRRGSGGLGRDDSHHRKQEGRISRPLFAV